MAICPSRFANQNGDVNEVERKFSKMNESSVSISTSSKSQEENCSPGASDEENMELRSMFFTESESLTSKSSDYSVLDSFSDLNMNQFTDTDSETVSGSLDLGFSSEEEDSESYYMTENHTVYQKGRKKMSKSGKSGSVSSTEEVHSSGNYGEGAEGDEGDDEKRQNRDVFCTKGSFKPELEDNSDWDNLSWRYLINMPEAENLQRARSWSAEEIKASEGVKRSSRRKSCCDPEELRKLCSLERIRAARERVQDAALQLVEAQLRVQEVQRRQSMEDQTGEGREARETKEAKDAKETKEAKESKEVLPRRMPKATRMLTEWLSGRSRGSQR